MITSILLVPPFESKLLIDPCAPRMELGRDKPASNYPRAPPPPTWRALGTSGGTAFGLAVVLAAGGIIHRHGCLALAEELPTVSPEMLVAAYVFAADFDKAVRAVLDEENPEGLRSLIQIHFLGAELVYLDADGTRMEIQ